MRKNTLNSNKLYWMFFYFIGVSHVFAQCPENISVNSTEGECSAVVSYIVTGSGEGGWSENGIINSSAETNLVGWTLDQNGGSGWTTDSGFFLTSYSTCSKSQVVDLSEDLGLSDEYMDTEPAISISDDYIGWTVNFADTYFLTVELRDEDDDVIATYTTGNITTSDELQTASHIFTDYGPGVRKVYFSHGGQDVEFWLGNYGAAMTNAQVKVALPGGEIVQTSGLPSGSSFPVGTTTNTFEISDDEGDITICSFDVIVTDSEGPVVAANETVAITLDENGAGSLTVEEVNNGSTDNCEIDTYELNKTEFTCEDIGENTVTFTVTDIHGNSSTADVAIIVTDESAPVAIAQNITVELNEEGVAEITPQQVDNGSTDNCNIVLFSLDKDSFTCDELGENEVIFTVEDGSGNTHSQTVMVTVQDPENYCNAAGIADFQSESIVIYPNPTPGSFEISGLPNGYDKIEFYDAVGKLVKVTTTEENNLSALETGIYFAKIFSKDKIFIKQVVKK